MVGLIRCGMLLFPGVGEHLLAVEDLVQKHALQELQVTAVGETLGRLRRHGSQFVAAKHRDAPILQERLDLCDKAYETYVPAVKIFLRLLVVTWGRPVLK